MSEALFDSIRGAYPAGCMTVQTTWNGAAFVAGVLKLFSPALAIEVGCCDGVTSSHLLQGLKELGRGRLESYEIAADRAAATRANLETVWAGGPWAVREGDFFETCTAEPVDFAFIDIDPKSLYTPAYQRIKFAEHAVCIAHDLDYDPPPVSVLRDVMITDGWRVFELHRERGFLLGVK